MIKWAVAPWESSWVRQRYPIRILGILLVECTKSAAVQSENHVKLLEALAGEVAEWLNAAVC